MKLYNVLERIQRTWNYYQGTSWTKYIYYNYLSSHIVRIDKAKLIPRKYAVLDFGKNSKIYLKENNIEIGANRLKGSKEETRLKLKENAEWYSNNGCRLYYGTTLEIHERARLETKSFDMNNGGTIICTKHIVLGDDVWMGRNITIYDSDYHSILNEKGDVINKSRPVIIGDHVWLTNQITVLKGAVIGKGAVIAPFSIVRKNIQENVMAAVKQEVEIIKEQIRWSSNRVPDWGYEKNENPKGGNLK